MKNHELVQQIDAALATHGSWHREIAIEIKRGRRTLSPDGLSDPTGCYFGHWLDSDSLNAEIRDSQPYGDVRALHAECHTLMGEISTLANVGRKPEAIALLNGRCEKLHAALEDALIALRAHVTRRRLSSSEAA